MTRIPFICGNWKLHHNVEQTRAQVRALVDGIKDLKGVEVGVAPVATTIFAAHEAAKGSALKLAGQNVHAAAKGAFTGELSVAHLQEVGCAYAIVGHSERRQYFAETDESVGKKVRAVLDGGLLPIACVGETLEEREAGNTMAVIRRQLQAILDVVNVPEAAKLVVAYEPVWAIGTGKTATAAQAQEVHAAIRAQLREKLGAGADEVRIQYGGSVKPENAAELLGQADIDGALVGGASLEASSLLAIAKAAASS
jgi:triosephosphate isomerase